MIQLSAIPLESQGTSHHRRGLPESVSGNSEEYPHRSLMKM